MEDLEIAEVLSFQANYASQKKELSTPDKIAGSMGVVHALG
jgi:hypothetical protein